MSIPETVMLMHNIGESPSKQPHIAANYNTRDEVANATGTLTFDGVYKNVYENRDLLEGRDVILFVMGDYIGKDNSFDKGMPREEYCTLKEIVELEKMGCKVGWHTWSHRDLTTLSDEEIQREITPFEGFPTDYFAYPYGRYNDRVLRLVEQKYGSAFSVDATDGTILSIPRAYV